jgi:tungstate transport system ATP-binding protein
MRLIDLLDRPSAGKIRFGETDSDADETVRLGIRRRMGMVFQKPSVLNTTVAENVAFGLKFRGVHPHEIRELVPAALDLVGLPHFADRQAATLSGGEMQRVALARAMVTKPEVLILDEPTANLDPVSSEMIENLVVRINKTFGTTIVLSTHDLIQGQRLADRMAVIMGGRIVQTGTIDEIFYRPGGRDIARFVGIDTALRGIVRSNDAGHALLDVAGTSFEAITKEPPGSRVALYIRPEEITLTLPADRHQKTSARNQLAGIITRMVPYGPFIRVTVNCGVPLTALITRRSAEDLALAVGTPVTAEVKASAIHVLPDET